MGILIGLGASIGTLTGYILSFTSMSFIKGGVIASVSMLLSSAITDTLRYYNKNDYLDIIVPDINSTIKISFGIKSSVSSLIKVSAAFTIGACLVSSNFVSPTAIGALTATVFSIIYVALLQVNKSKQPDSSVSEIEISNSSITDIKP
ncbi:hypothetical protein [Wolbachia endosymbiont of Tetranychus urticae]|uniref:hypothetical protein n=1 Tax=Wolbachia endosymbiont of Tetranychus urticae TaxID=169184 RepID=UPI00397AAAF5